jgi:inhibitor of KinA sporulation pathway (predicted exonuclease)
MRIPNNHYLIIDVEATCSNDGVVPREEMEIIEIGAVMQNSRTFEFESEFQSFVRPTRHNELTAFCRELTGISQNDVDSAPPFIESITSLKEWIGTFGESLFCSWGDYDRRQFIQDCDFHGIAYPFNPGHMNLKVEFANSVGKTRTMGITSALKYLGMKFEGSHHRGLDDAKNIARIVRRLCCPGS